MLFVLLLCLIFKCSLGSNTLLELNEGAADIVIKTGIDC